MAEVNDTKAKIRDFIIFGLKEHSRDIGRLVAERFGVSRVTATKHLQALIDEGVLGASGKTKARTYWLKPLATKKVVLAVTPDLQEDLVWSRDIKPELSGLKDNVLAICAHGVTEMLNNVISHSQSASANVDLTRNAAEVQIMVQDRGIGIFRKIKEQYNLTDLHHAVLELAKGKLTTDKAHHSGEGIFFTSRMFDDFTMTSDGLFFARSGKTNDWLLEGSRKPIESGTTVAMAIHTNAIQTVQEVFNAYRAEFDEFGFSKTVIPLTLMSVGDEQLISRSQAKRLMARVNEFREVILDFKGITSIGQAFADEVFRVYRTEHPQVNLHWIHANDDVERLITRVLTSSGSGETTTTLGS
jgi:anti-sigma regulatory factor (Ser/Thr protein kinase)